MVDTSPEMLVRYRDPLAPGPDEAGRVALACEWGQGPAAGALIENATEDAAAKRTKWRRRWVVLRGFVQRVLMEAWHDTYRDTRWLGLPRLMGGMLFFGYLLVFAITVVGGWLYDLSGVVALAFLPTLAISLAAMSSTRRLLASRQREA